MDEARTFGALRLCPDPNGFGGIHAYRLERGLISIADIDPTRSIPAIARNVLGGDVMADDRALILELEERYAEATNKSDVMEFDDLFAEDAMLMMPDRPAVISREAIVAHQREFFKSIKAQIKSIVAEVEVHETLVYTRGAFNYSMAPKMGGEAVVMRGKFINLYKKDEMDEWRIWRSINNIDHPHDD